MATKPTRPSTKDPDKKSDDYARFEAWLSDFDARQANLAARLDAFLHSLGVEPRGASAREPA
jgi:hypothetical protein